MGHKYRIAVDVGGTFSDFVALNEEDFSIQVIKKLSTPSSPSDGAMALIDAFQEGKEKEITGFTHATTIATNLFLGQTDLTIPRTALLTTKGFEDILEIGRQKRADLYNMQVRRPSPLIEVSMRFGITERMSSSGEELTPLNIEELSKIAEKLKLKNIESLAIIFLHSYMNPAHEQQAYDYLQLKLPDTNIIASFQVDPECREYERTSTTVIHSILRPVISTYLEKMEKELEKRSLLIPFHMMQSNGGLATISSCQHLPGATIESGPATGVTAAAYWGKLSGYNKILSFDMGGTTAKAGLILNHKPEMVHEYEIGGEVHSGQSVKGSGYPIRYTYIDLAEVSGGGGTLAYIDQGKRLRVGPISSGADPGPACYNRGGTDPTITDANLVLGRISPDGFSNGSFKLDIESARKAIKEKIADPCGLTIEEAASGIIRIINNQMIRALRLVSIQKGHDPRNFTMLSFGGGGPMHAAELAEEMDLEAVLIPPHSGVFSAFGLLLADFRHDFVSAIMRDTEAMDIYEIHRTFGSLRQQLRKLIRKEDLDREQLMIDESLDIRYKGQSFEIQVPWDYDLDECIEDFHKRHHKKYGFSSPEESVEIVNARMTMTRMTDKPEFLEHDFFSHEPEKYSVKGTRKVYFDSHHWMETTIFNRDKLNCGNLIEGPAVIEQYDTTIIVPPEFEARVDGYLNILLERIESE